MGKIVLIVTRRISRTIEKYKPQMASYNNCRLTGTFTDGRQFKIISKYADLTPYQTGRYQVIDDA